MFSEIKDTVKSPWMVAALLLFGTQSGRKFLRSAGKEAIKVGMGVSDKVKEIVAEVKEEADDLVAEVKAEQKHAKTEKATSSKAHV